MKNLYLTLFLVIFGTIFFTAEAKADLTCGGGCTSPEFCAIDPTSLDVNTTPDIPAAGCSEGAPTFSPNPGGDSWCTTNMLDGWTIISQGCSSSTVNNSKWFHYVTGSLETNDTSVCNLQPGDFKSPMTMRTTCHTDSTVNDPVSTLPPRHEESTTDYSTPSAQVRIGDLHLEGVVDCSYVNPGTNLVEPKVHLYYDAPALSGYDMFVYITRADHGGWSNTISSDSYTDTPSITNYLDTAVTNYATYDYQILIHGDSSAYYDSDNFSSEWVVVPVDCLDPAPDPQLNPGFNIMGQKNGSNVDLSWDSVSGATQYFVTKNNTPILNSINWTNYFLFHGRINYLDDFYATEVNNSSTRYANYITGTNSFTDINPDFSSGPITYRVYAYKPSTASNILGLIDSGGIVDWDPSKYTWHTRYPFNHNYSFSEEITVDSSGTIQETNTDPITSGPLAQCNEVCTQNSDCDSGLSCVSSVCRNNSCSTASDCQCRFATASVSSLTDVLSNNFTTNLSKHTFWYDIRQTAVVANGSLQITFPTSFNFGSLAAGDIAVSGGDVTWGSATVNSGNHMVVIPFTGSLNKDDGRITIEIGNTNFIANPVGSGNYFVNLTSHNSGDGSGNSVDDVSDEILIRDIAEVGSSSLSDTLSVSFASYDSRHTLRYNIGTTTAITDGSLKVVLAPEFDLSGVTGSDISVLGGDVTWGSATVTPVSKTVVIPFTGTLDNSDTLITLLFGNTNFINNPNNIGSYSVQLTTHTTADGSGTPVEDLTAMVAITGGVTVTATVPSSLTFTVAGVSSGTACANSGGNASVTSTSLAIPLGIYTGAQTKIACQTLTVSTNAGSGYIVSLEQNQDLTNASSNTMGKFTGTYSTPTIWASPVSPTKSFFGFTTDDNDLTNFQTNKYAQLAINNTPYTIMQATHSVADEGNVISYQLEVNDLQEAGIYSNTLRYIVTGTF